MTTEADRSLYRRALVCVLVGLAGIGVSLSLGLHTAHTEQARAVSNLEIQAFRLVGGIESQLDDAIRPLAALAVFMETQPTPNAERFRTLTRRIETLGIPIGRLGWEPRVPGASREAFEAEAREAGLTNYTIRKFTPEGRFEPADPAPEHFPIRLEATHNHFPSALGYDIISDPARRQVVELARDTAQPIGLFPAVRQAVLRQKPAFLIFWPLFDTAAAPETVTDRRRRLSGFVTVAVTLEDLLNHGVRGLPQGQETIVIHAANPFPDAPMEPIAVRQPGHGLTMVLPGSAMPEPGSVSFTHDFAMLGQQWRLTVSYGADAVGADRTTAWLISGTSLLGTALLALVLYTIMRKAERDRVQRREVESLMGEIARANEALLAANTQLSQRERAAAALVRARTRFLAAASHDLRQPLHALALFTSALARRVTGPDAVELVGNIRDLGMAMQRMFNSLLDLSRLDTGAVRANVAATDLDALVRRLFTEFAQQARAKNLSPRIAGRFPPLRTDPVLLESILRNLIDNAIKFTDHGGILIAGRVRANRVMLEIWDTGPGVPANRAERIFEEFERLDASARKPGFGLGLPIVRQLCGLIDAQVILCSRPGHGSRFSVALPYDAGAVFVPADTETDLAGDPAIPRRSILLADDDDSVLRALSLELRDQGHTVRAVSRGEVALALIRGEEQFDLAILDLRLGGTRDGWSLAAAWRAHRPGVPVILMTGSTDAETLERVRDSGLPALFKPVPPDQLHRAIANPTAFAQSRAPSLG